MTTPAIAPLSPQPLSEGARLLDTFIAPTKTFLDINRSAAWWMPFLIIVLCSYLFVFTVDKKVGFVKAAENQVRMNPRASDQLDQLPPDQRAQRMEISAKITRYISYSTPVISLAVFAIMSLLLWGSYSFGAGAQVGFGKVMAVVTYANMVGVLKYLLAVVALWVGADTDTFNMQNPSATNLGVLVDPIQHKVLFAFLSQLDIITFWVLALVAIGFTCITKVKKGTSFAIVFGWWLVLVLISVGSAAAFS